ncbi:hypothetical protein [Spiroplasma endosymbiont of Seladonia tumulorum]|uniref:hypothetical protein n=1 Tax=Spiroplasma endosymbiont of Seladonia tumulorum TaxID=3066321 RepID=UPI0030D107F1
MSSVIEAIASNFTSSILLYIKSFALLITSRSVNDDPSAGSRRSWLAIALAAFFQ